MKRAFTIKLPKKRLNSPAWDAYKHNIDRALLNSKIREVKHEQRSKD